MVIPKLISRLSIQRIYSSDSSSDTRSQAPPANIERRDHQRGVLLELAFREPVEYVELTSSSARRRAVGERYRFISTIGVRQLVRLVRQLPGRNLA